MAASTTSRALTRLARKLRAISISGRESGSPGHGQLLKFLGRTFAGEGDALDLDTVAVAKLQGTTGAGRRIDREELAPHFVHLIVIPSAGKHDGHLDDAV